MMMDPAIDDDWQVKPEKPTTSIYSPDLQDMSRRTFVSIEDSKTDPGNIQSYNNSCSITSKTYLS